MKEVREEEEHVMTLKRTSQPLVSLLSHWITCSVSRDLEPFTFQMAEKIEKKKSWTYKELVVATGGGEL